MALGALALSGLVLAGTAFGAVGDYKRIFGGVAADGTVAPTPVPTPTPTPVPPPADHCYDEPSAPDPNSRPADADSVLRNCQVIAYYGHPTVAGLGVLGEADADTVAQQVQAIAREYNETNGPRQVVGAYHLIVAVAQGSPTPDGTWLSRVAGSLIEDYIEAGKRNDFLVILDIQMGHSTVDAEFEYFLKYLDEPNVHLALDPEWAMPPGVAPGAQIGGMDASAINRAQELMSNYIADRGLTNRMLIVHQFVPHMITNKSALAWYPGVDLVIDTDGFGTPAQKIANYDRYIGTEYAPHGGMKLFYDEDTILMTPAEVNALRPVPDIVIFQ